MRARVTVVAVVAAAVALAALTGVAAGQPTGDTGSDGGNAEIGPGAHLSATIGGHGERVATEVDLRTLPAPGENRSAARLDRIGQDLRRRMLAADRATAALAADRRNGSLTPGEAMTRSTVLRARYLRVAAVSRAVGERYPEAARDPLFAGIAVTAAERATAYGSTAPVVGSVSWKGTPAASLASGARREPGVDPAAWASVGDVAGAPNGSTVGNGRTASDRDVDGPGIRGDGWNGTADGLEGARNATGGGSDGDAWERAVGGTDGGFGAYPDGPNGTDWDAFEGDGGSYDGSGDASGVYDGAYGGAYDDPDEYGGSYDGFDGSRGGYNGSYGDGTDGEYGGSYGDYDGADDGYDGSYDEFGGSYDGYDGAYDDYDGSYDGDDLDGSF